MVFDNFLNDLKVSSNFDDIDKNKLSEVISYYEKEFNGENEHLEDYEKIAIIIEPILQNNLISLVKQGLSLNDAIQKDVFVSFSTLKKWYLIGSEKDNKYSIFHLKLSKILEKQNKTNLIKHLKKGLSLEDAINQNDVLVTFKEVKKWYGSGSKNNKNHMDFYKQSLIYLNDFDFESKLSNDIPHYNKNINISSSKRKSISHEIKTNNLNNNMENSSVSKDSKIEVNNDILTIKQENFEFNSPNNFIKHLKNGLSFEEALNQSNVNWSFNDFRSYYDNCYFKKAYHSWSEYFYRYVSYHLQYKSQENIIKYLKNGLNINEVLKQKDVFHHLNDIKSWYNRGYDGVENYIDFYNEISPFIMEYNKKNILKYLNNNMEIFQIFSMKDIITNLNEFKSWYNDGSRGVEEHIEFYEKAYIILKERNIKILIKNVKRVGDLKSTIASLGVYCDIDEIEKWYIESNGNDSEIAFLHEIKIQEDIINIMKKDLVSFESLLNDNKFYYTSKEIQNWYNLGLEGKTPYNWFYEEVKKISEDNKMKITKNEVIKLVKKTKNLEEVLENNKFDYNSEEIMEWYNTGSYHKLHSNFRDRIDSIIGKNNKRKRVNAGGHVKF